MKSLFLKIKKLLINKWTITSLILLVCFIIFSNVWIIQSSKKNIYNSITETPKGNQIALILGTSRYVKGGYTNLFFKYRIEAAVKLYKSGKIKHILVSGDNRKENYNEPKEMLKALIKEGIPENAITLDYAGFRTLDSVIRCKKVFGQNKFIIISQRFHLERALFIAKKYDIDAIGFSAQYPPGNYSTKTRIREYFAKTLAVIDLYIIYKKPKFLGKKELIKI